MNERYDVFISYSRSDAAAANVLRDRLEKSGLSVFKDDAEIRKGDLWLDRLQDAVESCDAFVLLVGRDGVSRWVGAETQAALNRHFSPHGGHESRLLILPVLVPGATPDSLPSFLRLFQATDWDIEKPPPDDLIEQIRTRTAKRTAAIEGCPFVGLAAFRPDQAQLFFGRQKESLDAMSCFDTRSGNPAVRWLEINGNSGAGKSSLMNAGLLPLVDQGWLWPRTGFEHWQRIGPMMPGERPMAMLAEQLARAFGAEMAELSRQFSTGDESLSEWLRSRKDDDSAFLLAVDQFEELFTVADQEQRLRFDRLLAHAIGDPDCPLFLISTVRSDFLDRFAEELPNLVSIRNRLARPWTLAPIAADGLREVIAGPAQLANLDVSEVTEAIVADAGDEPGALPLVQNALNYLWAQRRNNKLSGQLFNQQGGLAGILSQSADGLLDSLKKPQRERALELLFQLVRVDTEGTRHTRRRIPLSEAIVAAGRGENGTRLIGHLAGRSDRTGSGPLRLVTVIDDGERTESWVSLIHETLVRVKEVDKNGKPVPYWPTLWNHIESNRARARRRERLEVSARDWRLRTGVSRLFGLAGWSSLFRYRGLTSPGGLEHRYIRWSRGRAVTELLVVGVAASILLEGLFWMVSKSLPPASLMERWGYLLGKPVPTPVLVEVPAGEFRMGSGAVETEQPVHMVTIAAPFFLAQTETTFEQWDACVAVEGCSPYRPKDGEGEEQWGRGTRPAIYVSWDHANEYATWLSDHLGTDCRLPTEAEWEYAARAGTTTLFAIPKPDGSDNVAGQGLANCKTCNSQWDDKRTAPVRSFPANSWGLYDMHGNVYEWVEDCVHTSYVDAPTDGSAWGEENGGRCQFRVLRGGSFEKADDSVRSAHRIMNSKTEPGPTIGFRVACASPGEAAKN